MSSIGGSCGDGGIGAGEDVDFPVVGDGILLVEGIRRVVPGRHSGASARTRCGSISHSAISIAEAESGHKLIGGVAFDGPSNFGRGVVVVVPLGAPKRQALLQNSSRKTTRRLAAGRFY